VSGSGSTEYFGAKVRSENAPDRVLKWLARCLTEPGKVPLSKEAPCYCQKIFLLSPIALLYLPLLKCGVAATDGDHSPQFPNQNLKYAIDFGALPNLRRTPLETKAPKQKSSICQSIRGCVVKCFCCRPT